MKLPIKISVERVAGNTVETYYEVIVIVPDALASKTRAMIQWWDSTLPFVDTVAENGLLDLADDVRDQLLLLLFRLAHDAMIQADGTSIEWMISDISRLITRQFGAVDVAAITYVLGTFADPSREVADRQIVRID